MSQETLHSNTVLGTLLTFSNRLLNENFVYFISSFMTFQLPFEITENENSQEVAQQLMSTYNVLDGWNKKMKRVSSMSRFKKNTKKNAKIITTQEQGMNDQGGIGFLLTFNYLYFSRELTLPVLLNIKNTLDFSGSSKNHALQTKLLITLLASKSKPYVIPIVLR